MVDRERKGARVANVFAVSMPVVAETGGRTFLIYQSLWDAGLCQIGRSRWATTAIWQILLEQFDMTTIVNICGGPRATTVTR